MKLDQNFYNFCGILQHQDYKIRDLVRSNQKSIFGQSWIFWATFEALISLPHDAVLQNGVKKVIRKESSKLLRTKKVSLVGTSSFSGTLSSL